MFVRKCPTMRVKQKKETRLQLQLYKLCDLEKNNFLSMSLCFLLEMRNTERSRVSVGITGRTNSELIPGKVFTSLLP